MEVVQNTPGERTTKFGTQGRLHQGNHGSALDISVEANSAVMLEPRQSTRTNVAAMLALIGNVAHNIAIKPTTHSTKPTNDSAIASVWQ